MSEPSGRLGQLLLEHGYIDQQQLEEALAEQQRSHALLGSILIHLGYVSQAEINFALAKQLDVRPWDLDEHPPLLDAIDLVPPDVCRQYCVLPVSVRDGTLFLAMSNPNDISAIDLVQNLVHLRLEPVFVIEDRLARAIREQHGSDTGQALDSFVSQALESANTDDEFGESLKSLTEEDIAPVVGLVNQLIIDAIRMRASDIHVEPRHDRVDIRCRVDGQLVLTREIPRKILAMVIARIKIMAELDIVENRLPQDGRISVRIDGRMIDLRISVLPNHYGQRIVMRVLDRASALKRIDEIGFSSHNVELFRNLVNKPYGMFLVTGPTGSGKTTTLYAALNELKQVTNNIMTCEDPVEYDLDGINQSQVHERIGLTFASQLRAILRQDPDIVLVGEIRDTETAEIAMRAAMTGHLVLSTLHSNDAPAAIPRLLDMGIDAYLLSTSLIGVMGQRLLRVLCPKCRELKPCTEEEQQMFAFNGYVPIPDETWHGVGCDQCHGKGYSGRIAVHEIMPISHEISKLIGQSSPIEQIRDRAGFFGYKTMQQDALDRVCKGQTSLQEAKRLIFFDSLQQVNDRRSRPAA